ncbi:lytic transglycosylase domain-containing protein [Nereida sp. MMG025]|uniref:lytic transglycosylase domain-containing protein n=1 Tax=Nereida sp. MMG025 TaxID=2909981 RepID=UPI001F1B51B3|nr:lytic transglycosylase domain-containing protein [Nereida sp. MMG025]MCF6443804.1 lytic transglycosylase domain-containing protein [Nereida sp. MMG025]
MRWFVALMFFLSSPLLAEPPDRACTTQKWGHKICIRNAHFAYDTCSAIDHLAQRHGLNRDFFARLIWQESRFNPNALSHANARGIAQFIPSTAHLRGLQNPYNPADALDHSAQYLAEMVAKYGNEGMAAIGYNGGEARAEGFLDGKGLAPETVNYVPIITGLPAEAWRDGQPKTIDLRLSKDKAFLPACLDMAKGRAYTKLAPPKPSLRPWGVQLAFGPNKSVARASYKRKTARCRSTVASEQLDLVYKRAGGNGRKGYYMARISRNSRSGADALCRKLARAGCTCRVYRN